MDKTARINKIKFLLGAVLAAAILLFPQTAVDSARSAMAMWYSSVAPAIFPFLALMPLLTGPEACAAYEKIFSKWMDSIFRLPGSAAPALIISLISGSPAGAAAITAIAGPSGMTLSQLRRFAPAVCGVGPAYLVLGVGVSLFGSVKTGVKLAAVQIFVQLLTLFVLRLRKDDDAEPLRILPFGQSTGQLSRAVRSTLTVCGYMVFFSVAASVMAQICGETLGKLLLLAADLPSGMASLSGWSLAGRNQLLGMALGFSGLCIISQNMDLLRPLGLRWKDMLSVKFAQSAFCGAVLPLVLRKDFRIFRPNLKSGPSFYVFSLLIALILSLPILIYLSNKLFLNKTNPGNTSSS